MNEDDPQKQKKKKQKSKSLQKVKKSNKKKVAKAENTESGCNISPMPGNHKAEWREKSVNTTHNTSLVKSLNENDITVSIKDSPSRAPKQKKKTQNKKKKIIYYKKDISHEQSSEVVSGWISTRRSANNSLIPSNKIKDISNLNIEDNDISIHIKNAGDNTNIGLMNPHCEDQIKPIKSINTPVWSYQRNLKDKKKQFAHDYDSTLETESRGILGTYSAIVSYKPANGRKYLEGKLKLFKTSLIILENTSNPDWVNASTMSAKHMKSASDARELSVINSNNRTKTIEYITERISPSLPYTVKDLELFYKPKLILNFDLLTVKILLSAKKRKVNIYIWGSNKHYKFKFGNEELFSRFTGWINNAVQYSNGNKRNLLGIVYRPNFDSSFYISYSEFGKRAKTGDCLIFRGFECNAKCQRVFTGAEYDHVALLERKGEWLNVYESTGKDGAKVRNWREFVGYAWNLLYEKMVFREWIIDLPSPQKEKAQEEIEGKLKKFIKDTEGKKYSLNFCSILFGGSKKEHEKNNQWNKSSGFFCSQLLIAAYIASGIVPYVKESGEYWPGVFAQGNTNLVLNKNIYLGPEVVIDFTWYNP